MSDKDNVKLLDAVLLGEHTRDDFMRLYKEDLQFKEWLDHVLPSIAESARMKQDNPWHIYNVLDHILHSVESINKMTNDMDKKDRRMLAYTMFFHDLGKPACHIRRISNGREIDCFFMHNIESEKIAREALPQFGFSSEEVNTITKLVFKHDIFMFIKPYKSNNPHWRVLSKEVVQQEIEDLNRIGDGRKLLGWLVMVGRADNLAQNPAMTKESLALLDSFESLIFEAN